MPDDRQYHEYIQLAERWEKDNYERTADMVATICSNLCFIQESQGRRLVARNVHDLLSMHVTGSAE